MNKNSIEKLKLLTINMLQEAQNNHMEYKQQLKNFIISILLTFLPILIFFLMPLLEDRYFDLFAGRFMYLGQDYYFSFSPFFIFDLPYFLTPIISTITIWFCLKIRKSIENRRSFFNYSILVLIILNCVFLLSSLYFIIVNFL